MGKCTYLIISLLALGVFYLGIVNKLPVSYWDEYLWVGRSFFFEYFIEGDYASPVWESPVSFDQPKLGEYMYGAWIYPKYLSEKGAMEGEINYVKYLMEKGFFMVDQRYVRSYARYYKEAIRTAIRFDYSDSGSRAYYQNKYGEGVLKTIDLILYARLVNIIWLLLSVLVVYRIMRFWKSRYFSYVFSLVYGISNLVVTTSLKAHSEAIFLFLFNASILAMLYHLTTNKLRYLLSFATLSGLCLSTKLNGIMLLPIFVISKVYWRNVVVIGWGEKVNQALLLLTVSFAILLVMNPYVYKDPIGRMKLLFEKRFQVVELQSQIFPDDVLATPGQRYLVMIDNFFGRESAKYNGVYQFKVRNMWHGILLGILFIVGLADDLIVAIKKRKYQMVIMVSFGVVIASMGQYLSLNWERYYIQLVLFVFYYEFVGLQYIYSMLARYRTVRGRSWLQVPWDVFKKQILS